MFKSYYVVWKQIKLNRFELPFDSLNRTMQYGNDEATEIIGFDGNGLNRTMQYGNLHKQTNQECESVV